VFGLVESRAAEPILPLWVFGRRIFASTSLVSLIVGVLLIGLSSYVPLYAQGVFGTTAVVGGFTVAAMTVGWPIAASLSGRLYLRHGFRTTAFVGAVFLVAGSAALLFVDADDTAWHLAIGCFVIGLGLGLTSAPALVAAQHASTWSTRGVVTGTNMFARSVGSAVGIAVFGAVANAAVTRRLGGEHPELEKLSPSVLAPSIHEVFVGGAVAAVVMVAAICLMPRKVEAPDA
jgi:MFS family permease